MWEISQLMPCQPPIIDANSRQCSEGRADRNRTVMNDPREGLKGSEMTQYEGGRPETRSGASDIGMAWAMIGAVFLVALLISVLN
jgi:hypothetical protein